MFPRPGGPCLCGHSSREQQAAAGSRQPQAAAGNSRQQQASVGNSRHKQTSQQPASRNVQQAFCRRFQKGRSDPGNAWAVSLWAQQQQQSLSPFSSMGFLAGSRLFEGSAAAAAPSSRHRETYSNSGPGKRIFWTLFVLQGHGVSPSGRAVSLWAQQQQQQQSLSPFSSIAAFLKGQLHQQQQQLPVASIEKRIASFFWEISEGTFWPRETSILDSVRPSGPWCFPVREGRVFVGTAAGSSRQQQAAGSRRQQQATAGSSRHQ